MSYVPVIHIRDNPNSMAYCNENPFQVWAAVTRLNWEKSNCNKCKQVYQIHKRILEDPNTTIETLFYAGLLTEKPTANAIIEQQMDFIQNRKYKGISLTSQVDANALHSRIAQAELDAVLPQGWEEFKPKVMNSEVSGKARRAGSQVEVKVTFPEMRNPKRSWVWYAVLAQVFVGAVILGIILYKHLGG